MMKIRRRDDNSGLETIKALIAALMISLVLFTIWSRRESQELDVFGMLPFEQEEARR